MDIYDINNNVLIQDVPLTSSAELVQELMRCDYVQLAWRSAIESTIPSGAYISIGREKYRLISPYSPEQRSEAEWEYRPQFQSEFWALSKVPFFMYTTIEGETTKEADWTLTDNPANFMRVLCEGIENETGLKYTYAVDNNLQVASATVQFNCADIVSASTQIANAFETELWLEKYAEEDGGGNVGCLHLGKAQFGETPVELEVGVSIKPPSVTKNDDYYNRFYVFGSSRNITQDYQGASVNNIATKRLTLNPTQYPDGYLDYSNGGPVYSKVLQFDDVYPSATDLVVMNIRSRTRWVLDESTSKPKRIGGTDESPIYDTYSLWYVQLKRKVNGQYIDFNYSDSMALPGLVPSLHFNSGPLSGREFEVIYHSTGGTVQDGADPTPFVVLAGDFEIKYKDENGFILPSTVGLVPETDDLVVLFNVKMPDAYITSAQDRLAQVAVEEINKNYINTTTLVPVDKNSYQAQSDPTIFYVNEPGLHIGTKVLYVNGDYEKETRVTALRKRLDLSCYQTITFGDEIAKGNIEELKEDAVSANRNIDLLAAISKSTSEITAAYERTHQLLLQQIATAGSYWIEYSQVVGGTVVKSLKLNPIYAGAWAKGFITAGGIGTSGGGGGGGLIETLHRYADLGGSFSDSANDTFNAYTINKINADLSARIAALEGGSATSITTTGSGNVITALSKSGTEITATKGITALTSHQTVTLARGTNNGTLKLTTAAGTTDNIEVKGLAALAYKSSLDFSELTGKPTTLSGYGITDAYTKTETDSAISTAIDALPNPMIFKGSLGTGGTITTLPDASASNEGWTYKVITAGTYQRIIAKVGDTFVSNGSSWILIPSGDEPSGTVTSVGLSMPTGFSVDSRTSPVTTSGTISVGFATGYSLPTTAKQTAWDAKYDKPSTGIPNADLANSSITIGSKSISLGGSSTLTQIGVPAWAQASALAFDSLPSMYIAKNAVQSSSAVQDLTGLGNLEPDTNNTKNLGSSSKIWSTIFANDGVYYAGLAVGSSLEITSSGIYLDDSSALSFASNNGSISITETYGVELSANDQDGTELRLIDGAANFKGHVFPRSNNTYSLGSPSLRWSTIYGVNGDFSGTMNVSGATSLSSGLTVSGNSSLHGNVIIGAGTTYPSFTLNANSQQGLKITGEDATGSNDYIIFKLGKLGVHTTPTSSSSTVDINGTLGATGLSTLAGGIALGTSAAAQAATLVWDATNNAWHLQGNFYADGFITAGGIGTSGGSGGGGLIETLHRYADLGGSFSDSANDTFNAYTINKINTDLDARITALEGGSATNVTTTGSGNVVSSVTKSGTTITVTKGITALTSHQSLDGYVNEIATGTGNYITGVSKSGKKLTFTYGTLPTTIALSNVTGADDLKAIEALTGTSGLLKKTAANTWTLDTTTYLSSHQTVTLASGTNNGTLKITTAAGTTDNIAVTGLGSLAYKSSLVASDIPDLSGTYLPLSGGTMTGTITKSITSSGAAALLNVNVGRAGGWNQRWANIYVGDDLKFIYGLYGSGTDTLYYAYIGHDTSQSGDNLRIYSDKVQFGSNLIYHAGNLSLATLAGSSSIGTSTQPVYYNGSALSACDLSTTYAPYDANGYVKLVAGTSEQTISSSISSISKGVVNFWRKSGDHYTFIGFSNGTTETYLGGIGFKSQSDHNLYRKDGSDYYKIYDESNLTLTKSLVTDALGGTPSSMWYAYNGTAGYWKIHIKSKTGWFLAFSINLYTNYRSSVIRVSGYNYSTTKKWYSPKAFMVGSTSTNSIDVTFGKDGDRDLWVVVPVSSYNGISITDVVYGNTGTGLSYNADAFEITKVTEIPETVVMTITVYPPLSISGGTISGDLEVSGTLEVTGATTLSSTLNAGATTLASLSVTGAATIGSTLGVTGAVTLSSTLSAGASTLASLGVTGAATIGTTLSVTGATTLSSTLGVTGATTLSSTLGVTGAATLSSTLGVTGVSTLAGGLALGTTTNAQSDTLVWDEDNRAWHLQGNFYADGFITAGGIGSGGGGGITIDDALSPTSENPVQNKVIYAAIGNIESALAAI